MDDLTKKRFDQVDAKIDSVKDELSKKIDGMAKVIEGTVIAAIEVSQKASTEILNRAAERRHAEQTKKFQAVITEAERIGSATAHDTRVAALETELGAVKTSVEALTLAVEALKAAK